MATNIPVWALAFGLLNEIGAVKSHSEHEGHGSQVPSAPLKQKDFSDYGIHTHTHIYIYIYIL